MKRISLVLMLLVICSMFIPAPSGAQFTAPPRLGPCGERVFALTTGNNLLSFSSDTPGLIISSTPITGLLPGESLLGIDYRPAIREIFGLSDQNRLYVIDSNTGLARIVGTLFVNTSGAAFGIDFNPVPDRLRVVSDSNQNLRINVETGMTTVDGTLAFAGGDRNANADPNIVAAAYSNNFAGTTTTTLYGIDSNLDILVIQNPPNDGRLNTVGPLGVNASDLAGFDIAAGSARAFAALTTPGSNSSSLYTINLRTGAASLVGTIGGGELIRDITVSPRRSLTVFALTTRNNLITFDSDSPERINSVTRIRGLLPNETVLGIDFRSANRRLYALGSTGRVYTINLSNGRVTPRPLSPFSQMLSGSSFGFDFNPVPDRIRVTSDADQDLRLEPDLGEVVGVDGTLTYVAGDPNAGRDPNVVGSAYTNNFAGTTTTMLYNIDSNLDVLVIQNPPNSGTLNTVGPLGVNTSDLVGFDIVGCDVAGFAALTLPGEAVSKFYRIDLTTGTATLVGNIGSSELIRGIAVATK